MSTADATLDLNPAQRAAVEHGAGALLVVAGAGSGKTRVLTARVARLIEQGVPPEAILAFTFTNRAAREMRDRIGRACGEQAARLWVGTFHATGVRILRRESRALAERWPGFPAAFAIFDRDDQESVLRAVRKALELPDSFKLAELLASISDAKNALVTPAEAAHAAVTPYERRMAEVHAAYEAALRRQGGLDFDDLIVEVVRLFRERPEIGARWAHRFRHVLVDEYQDTNHAQFRMVQALTGHGNLFVVGDDDQSIYGFRGANPAHVLDFEESFPGAAVMRLEQNYRSTASILRAANGVIANNRERRGKELWTERQGGEGLRFVLAADETDEARRVSGTLLERRRRGRLLADCAVLYRTNAQSRALETELRRVGLRYEIVGGISFYQRREVKDVLAYLRLAVNPADETSFWRIWNTPRRGLGEAVRARVEERLRAGATDPLGALRALVAERVLPRPADAGARALLEALDDLRARLADPVHTLLPRVLESTGYLRSLEDLPEAEAADRRANVAELVTAAVTFASEAGDPTLAAFLAETALLTDLDQVAENEDRVLLLTAHNAKGLEFDLVIVTGLEEGLMPHASAVEEPRDLEEERRLFYVAITRAREQVLLTAAAYRRRFDGAWGGQVSRFVDEIPAALLERESTPAAWSAGVGEGGASTTWRATAGGDALERPAFSGAGSGGRARSSRTSAADRARSAPAYRTAGALVRAVGREVYHESFGRGVVVAAEAAGAEVHYTVRFGTRIRKVQGRFLTGGPDGDHA
jgi:ATP-dependent DNA helicase UvrD/PcrA